MPTHAVRLASTLGAAALLLFAPSGRGRVSADDGERVIPECTRLAVSVRAHFDAARYGGLAGFRIAVGYQPGKVGLPGTFDDASVTERVRALGGVIVTVLDDDSDNNGVEDTITLGGLALTPTLSSGDAAARVDFDCLSAAGGIASGDFSCAVLDAATAEGDTIDAPRCSVELSRESGQ